MNYQKITLSILSGVLLGISWPPFGCPIFIFFSFIPLLLIENKILIKKEKKSFLKVFLYSYLSFLIWNFIVIQWLRFSKRPDGTYAFEALLIPLLSNSFLMSTTFSIYHWVRKKISSLLSFIFFISIWITFESVHLNWKFTFPWLNLGNVFAQYHKWIQWYEYTGIFGGTLWILLINIFIFQQYLLYKKKKKNIYIKKIFLILLICIGTPILISYFLYISFHENSKKIESIILQPNLDPYKEKNIFSTKKILSILLKLTNKKITQNTKFIIAPETILSSNERININNIDQNFYVKNIKQYLNIKNNKCIFILGVNTFINYSNNTNNKESIFWNPYLNKYQEYFNSAIQITNNDSTKIYHKSKLVIGIERMPFSKNFNLIIQKLLKGFNGQSISLGTQPESSVFKNKFNKIIIAPIICYESIYGEYVCSYIRKGANLLVVMTNDSWWENSAGYKQLLMLTKLRAIETRKNIIRSANSGISCVINSKGDIYDKIEYLEKKSKIVNVTINNYSTLYVLYGDYISKISLFFLLIISIYIFFIKICKKKKKIVTLLQCSLSYI